MCGMRQTFGCGVNDKYWLSGLCSIVSELALPSGGSSGIVSVYGTALGDHPPGVNPKT